MTDLTGIACVIISTAVLLIAITITVFGIWMMYEETKIRKR